MKTKIWIALITLYIVWGSTYLGIKFAIETIPPFFHAGLRFFISGLILIIWQRSIGHQMPTRKQWPSTLVIGLLLLLGGNGLVAWAELSIPSGIAALIVGAIPMFMVIGDAIRPNGVRLNWRGVIGLIIGFAGVFILIGPSDLSGSYLKLNPLGVTALFFACFFWAIGSLYSKTADLPKSSLMNTGAQMLMGSFGLLTFSLISGELHNWVITQVSAHSLYALFYLITVRRSPLITFSS